MFFVVFVLFVFVLIDFLSDLKFLLSGWYMVFVMIDGEIVVGVNVNVDDINIVFDVVFDDDGMVGVVLWINSLGGSLV